MPEDSQHDRNMQHVLTGLIQFVVVDSSTSVSFNKTYAEEHWQKECFYLLQPLVQKNHFAERTLRLSAILWYVSPMLFGVERCLFLSSWTYLIRGVVLYVVTSTPAREVQMGIKKVNSQEKTCSKRYARIPFQWLKVNIWSFTWWLLRAKFPIHISISTQWISRENTVKFLAFRTMTCKFFSALPVSWLIPWEINPVGQQSEWAPEGF